MLDIKTSDKWIKQGAPAQALDFLGAAVDGLSQKAVQDKIVFKGKDTEVATNKSVTKEVEEPVIVPIEVEEVDDETETVEAPAEIADEDVTKDVPATSPAITPDSPATPEIVPATTPSGEAITMKAFETAVATAIVVALKQFNDDVVAPLQAQIAEIVAGKTVTNKGTTMLENVFMNASDFMPAAAVSAMLKKEFGSGDKTQAGDIVATDAEVAQEATVVKAKKVTKSIGEDGNVLSGF